MADSLASRWPPRVPCNRGGCHYGSPFHLNDRNCRPGRADQGCREGPGSAQPRRCRAFRRGSLHRTRSGRSPFQQRQTYASSHRDRGWRASPKSYVGPGDWVLLRLGSRSKSVAEIIVAGRNRGDSPVPARCGCGRFENETAVCGRSPSTRFVASARATARSHRISHPN